MSSSVSAPSLMLLLRCWWVGMPPTLSGMVGGRRWYYGVVVADNDRADPATHLAITGHPLI